MSARAPLPAPPTRGGARPRGALGTSADGTLALATLGVIALATLGAPAPAVAQPGAQSGASHAPTATREPLVTDRPDFTEAPNVVGARTLQLEAGQTSTRAAGLLTTTYGEGLLRIGVSARAELRLGLSSYVRGHASGSDPARPVTSGFGDPSLGAKIVLVPEGRGAMPATSLLVGTSLPLGSAAHGSHAAEPGAKLALAWALGERWAVSSNLNHTWLASDDGGRTPEPAASLSVARTLTARIGSYVEAFALRPRGGTGTQYVNGGLTLLLSPQCQVDARLGTSIGSAPAGATRFVGAGLARRW